MKRFFVVASCECGCSDVLTDVLDAADSAEAAAIFRARYKDAGNPIAYDANEMRGIANELECSAYAIGAGHICDQLRSAIAMAKGEAK